MFYATPKSDAPNEVYYFDKHEIHSVASMVEALLKMKCVRDINITSRICENETEKSVPSLSFETWNKDDGEETYYVNPGNFVVIDYTTDTVKVFRNRTEFDKFYIEVKEYVETGMDLASTTSKRDPLCYNNLTF